MTVVFREEALADLEEIGQFIAQYDPAAARRVIARIHRTVYRTIEVLPLSGRLNPRITRGSMQFLACPI